MKVGFIGLGIMGGRMAANLQKHDHQLVVYNRTPEKARSLSVTRNLSERALIDWGKERLG